MFRLALKQTEYEKFNRHQKTLGLSDNQIEDISALTSLQTLVLNFNY